MRAADKRSIIVVLRWVLIIAISYLLLFSAAPGHGLLSDLFVVLFLVSNLILIRLPLTYFHHRAFDLILVCVDITFITLALWLCGSAGANFFFVFFFVVFLASLGDSPALTAIGALMAAAAYLFLLHPGSLWDSAILLHVPFFFITAVTYGYLAHTAREAAARAQAANDLVAMKKGFIGTMSHEMRSPLGVVVMYSQLLADGRLGQLTTAQREGAMKIRTHAYELLELIDQTLTASRLEFQDIPVHVTEFGIKDVVTEVLLSVEPYAKESVRLTVNADGDLPPLVTDRFKLKEVLTNLLSNALKYTDSGEVEVDFHRPHDNGSVEFTVRDTGIGMTSDSLANVFGLFTRAPEVDATCPSGVGLGLYIVRRLVDTLQGDIRVASELGKGSTFTVRIPGRLPTS